MFKDDNDISEASSTKENFRTHFTLVQTDLIRRIVKMTWRDRRFEKMLLEEAIVCSDICL